ncbi:MAG: beta-N-acetylglucosaminidase domain-containing protein [Gemmatimonadota bacterium]|nr:beta-N-acetylglucosaminidase domain-containing protein [Gemmatimonadota bacterium]
MTPPELGIIEGYYGQPWEWGERMDAVSFFAAHGYGFYLYAPKGDAYLRRRWREPHPHDQMDRLMRLAKRCREAGMRFGVGLSPIGLQVRPGADARQALERKLAWLDDLDLDDFALLFDDMRGDILDLADTQAAIADCSASRVRADRLFVCPTYYADDPALDRAFGPRPANYLERLGELLDMRIQLFWTGEEVVSRELSVCHLERVAEQIRRKPFLWDNYPVNDGVRMSQFLHVRGFTGRPAALADIVAGHGINPALQPVLARVPALTLIEAYTSGEAYTYGEATRRAAHAVLGEELGEALWRDLPEVQEVGLDRLGPRATELRARYAGFDHRGAREVVAWLNGDYRVTDHFVQAQSGEV